MLTIEEKRQFVESAKADSARFFDTKTTPAAHQRMVEFRQITSQAEGHALTRRARMAADMADAQRGPDDVVPDADDSSLQRGMLT